MPVYLNEAQAGSDANLIGFPHLVICMGVVLQTNAYMYGYHFDHQDRTAANCVAFANFIAKRRGRVANGVRLYGCGNLALRYEGGGRQAWRAEMRLIAGALGYHGRVSGFDTGIINPQDGTYVEYIPDYPQQRCRIFYKRNEKMDIDTSAVMGSPVRNMAPFRLNPNTYQMVPKIGILNYTGGAVIRATDSNRGALHEVNYFLRLANFEV